MQEILAIVSYYNCFRDFILFSHSPQYKLQTVVKRTYASVSD